MPLLNQFGTFSDSWHVAVNSDVKHTMHDIGVHDVALHDVTVHDEGMPGMAVPSMDVHKT
jgi:hypothetical protein